MTLSIHEFGDPILRQKAQIIKHKADHLNGVMFVDKTTDSKTYMTMGEYRKRIKSKD